MSSSESKRFHPSHEDIAAFVDGSMGEIDEARIRVHLDCCESCLETYRYAVRFVGSYAGGVVDPAPSIKAVRAAKALASRRYRREHFDRRGRRRWLADLSPAGRAMVAVAVVAVFAAAVVWLRPVPGGGFDMYAESIAPVTRALIESSERNPLVIPGVETEIGAMPPEIRSGSPPVTPELNAALAALATDYNSGNPSRAQTRWLIAGYLATGQLENARVYLEDARARHPSDAGIAVLAGMLDWSRSDLKGAAERFAAALDLDGDHLVAAYNLAVVRMETGDAPGARELLERIRRRVPDSPLAERARTVLDELP